MGDRMLISESYRQLNKQMHEEVPHYGAGAARKWGQMVLQLMEQLNTCDILDYGAGKRTLGSALRETFMKAGAIGSLKLQEYDPAVPEIAADPSEADIVVCLDVLEHIEPECLGDVLQHLFDKARKIILAVVNTGPAVKSLPDGRNAHLIQQSMVWWANVLDEKFSIRSINVRDHDAVFIMQPRKKREPAAEPIVKTVQVGPMIQSPAEKIDHMQRKKWRIGA